MKIGFSTDFNGPGGARSWIKGFSHYCVSKGCEVSYGPSTDVDVFCSVANLSKPSELEELQKNKIKILQRLGAIYLLYNHHNPNLIQSKNDELKKIITYADSIVYQSKFCKETLFGSLYKGLPPDGDIIYNCADSEIFTPFGPTLERSQDKKIILAAAYWGTPDTATKSMEILMRVLRHFETYKDIEFWILGRAFPIHQKMLQDAHFGHVTKLDLLNPIAHDAMPILLRSVDMVLHLKAHEGCSNMVIETMNIGTPLVGLHTGSLPELVDDAALLANCAGDITAFPAPNANDLLAKIYDTLNHLPDFQAKMLERAKLFSPESTYEKYLIKLKQLSETA